MFLSQLFPSTTINRGLHNSEKTPEVITRSKKELVDQTLQIPPQVSSFKFKFKLKNEEEIKFKFKNEEQIKVKFKQSSSSSRTRSSFEATNTYSRSSSKALEFIYY